MNGFTGVRRIVAGLAAVAGAAGFLAVPAAAATGEVAGAVFDDANRNGVRDAGEAPVSGKVIELYDVGAGTFVSGMLTDADGRYSFGGLGSGSYLVRFSTADWKAMRTDWVPTTTGSLKFERTVAVDTAAVTADFGLRRIVRSTTLGSPISSATAANGTRFESYNDVVTASELVAVFETRVLRTAQPSNVVVRFDHGTGNRCTTTVAGGEGSYTGFSAQVWVDYVSWLETGDRGFFHEYGHAWTIYHELVVQQDDDWTAYLQARGLAGDPRLWTSKNWDPRELAAEDWRQLFASTTARSHAHQNTEVPAATDVAGLAEWMEGTFTQPPGAPPADPSGGDPAPAPTAIAAIEGLGVNPTPLSTQGTISFTLTAPARVTVEIVNSSGAVVRTLVADADRSGSVSTVWDRKTSDGRKAKAGSYSAVVRAVEPSGSTATASAPFTVADPTRGKR